METWELTIGITGLAMVIVTAMNLGALLYKEFSKNKADSLFWITWPTLMINLTGIAVIFSVLIMNIY